MEAKHAYLKNCHSLMRMCDKYRKYMNIKRECPQELKLCLWIDRLQLASMILTESLHSSFVEPEGLNDEEKKLSAAAMAKLDDTGQNLLEELQSLFQHVQSISTRLVTIEQKLNEVLEGPDYPKGKEIMKQAHEHYDVIIPKFHG